jgi:hypothetical protein
VLGIGNSFHKNHILSGECQCTLHRCRLTQRDYRGKCHFREEQILNCSCITLNADYEERKRFKRRGTYSRSNTEFSTACRLSRFRPSVSGVSSIESNLVPRSSATRRGGESPTENPAATESAKNLKNLGGKCRKSEEQSVACQLLLTERQGQNVVRLETKQ